MKVCNLLALLMMGALWVSAACGVDDSAREGSDEVDDGSDEVGEVVQAFTENSCATAVANATLSYTPQTRCPLGTSSATSGASYGTPPCTEAYVAVLSLPFTHQPTSLFAYWTGSLPTNSFLCTSSSLRLRIWREQIGFPQSTYILAHDVSRTGTWSGSRCSLAVPSFFIPASSGVGLPTTYRVVAQAKLGTVTRQVFVQANFGTLRFPCP